MNLTYPENLPITAQREKIAAALRRHQTVIIAGETGSGKTTQLPKICREIGRRKIACTEPRRIAAVSVAERIAQELQTPLGELVGYRVRFAEKVSAQTQIVMMTDGVLLAQTRRDPQLRAYDTLIIDEVHERSLNIDFLLGVIKRLLPQRRDLKIVICSATLDTAKFSEFFAGAPVLNIEGRGFPVEIIYLPPPENAAENPDDSANDEAHELPQLISGAVQKLWAERGARDTLAFVSGEQDIRDTLAQLAKTPLPPCEILPLYGRLPAEQQRAIFYPQDLPRVIVATNVAETSLTVPRVGYVIDSGSARLKRYNARTQIEMLPVEKISQAAANQRAGRCGRVAPGVCARLYGAEDFSQRETFTPPEILRSSLAAVILQMQALKLGEPENFPFIDAPPRQLLKSAYAELTEIGALDAAGKITPLGEQLAALPVSPRYGKILLTAQQLQVRDDALTIVAALEIADPRLRPPENRDAADLAHRAYADTFSDFLTLLNLWRKTETARGEMSGNQFHRFCRDNFLSWRRLREWRETRAQLAKLVGECLPESRNTAAVAIVAPKKKPVETLPNAALHRALLSGLLGKIGAWHEDDKIYRGARGANFYLHPASGIRGKPAWIMAAEIVETSRVFARLAAAIDPEWIETAAAHLLKFSYREPFFDEKFGCVRAYAQATLFGLPVIEKRLIHYGAVAPAAAREILLRDGLVAERAHCNLEFFTANKTLLADLRAREQKLRRRDLIVSAETLFAFYDARVPPEIHTVAALEKFVLAEQRAQRAPLTLTESDVVMQTANGLSDDLFPPMWKTPAGELALTYKFAPGDSDDGVTCVIPAGTLASVNPADFEWLVPGLLGEKTAQLLRALPRGLRRELAPIEAALAKILPRLRQARTRNEDFLAALATVASQISGAKIGAENFDCENLPPFLRMNFSVSASDGKILATGRDLEKLQSDCALAARQNFLAANKQAFERGGIKKWDFVLPETVALGGGALGYPALRDCGDSVAIILCETAFAAENLTRRGIRRLIFNELAEQKEKIRRSLAISGVAQNYFAAIRGENLPEQILHAAADYRLQNASALPRNREQFAMLLADFRRDFYPLAHQLSLASSAALEKAFALHSAIFAEPSAAQKFSFHDLRRHFAALINPNFVGDAGAEKLPDLPRYIDGIELRLKKMNENLSRDRQRAQEISPFWDYAEREFAKFAANKKTLAPRERAQEISRLKNFRWLLEDFRLTLFAQEIAGKRAVNAEKLRGLMKG